MRVLVLLALAPVAVLVGVNAGWRWVAAPVLGYALLLWLLASLRVLAVDAKGGAGATADPEVLDPDARTLYWCEECGTELLLLVRGTTRAPTHCGQRMHERTEIPS